MLHYHFWFLLIIEVSLLQGLFDSSNARVVGLVPSVAGIFYAGVTGLIVSVARDSIVGVVGVAQILMPRLPGFSAKLAIKRLKLTSFKFVHNRLLSALRSRFKE